MVTHEELICSTLGNDVEFFTLAVDGDTWHGWAGPTNEASWGLVETLWKVYHQRNIRLFQGFCHELDYDAVMAIPNMPVLTVAKYCGTGAYILEAIEETIKEIQDTLVAIWNECPFEILWGDLAALEGGFIKPPNEQQARTIEELISSLSLVSITDLISIWEFQNNIEYEDKDGNPLEPFPEIPEIFQIIQETQKFRIQFNG